MRNWLPIKSSGGSSLMSVLLAIGLMGIATLGILSWSNQRATVGRQINNRAVADQIKQRLVGAVISPNSWQITQAQNTSAFSNPILTAHSEDGQKPPLASFPSLNIHIAGSASPYYLATDPKAGFDLSGFPCATFDSQNGNDACPFRYDVRLVRHVFQNGNWIDTVHFEMTFRPASSKLVLNSTLSKYTFDLVRNLDEKSVESSCISLNGQYSTASGECSVRITKATSCSQTLTAYRGPASENGQPCETTKAASMTCGAGQVIKGFDNRGYPLCAAL